MKKYVAFSVMAVTALGVTVSHMEIEHYDDSYLLKVDGVVIDVCGHVSAALNRLTRRCEAIAPSVAGEYGDDALAASAMQAIREHSPPDSRRLQLRQLLSSGPWMLAEVEFLELQPAVILLEQKAHSWAIPQHAIWSGSTQPWLAGPWIRSYLHQRAPQAPMALMACFEPSPALFDLH